MLLEQVTDPDENEDDGDGDKAEPERLLEHALRQWLERDVLHRNVALGAWNRMNIVVG